MSGSICLLGWLVEILNPPGRTNAKVEVGFHNVGMPGIDGYCRIVGCFCASFLVCIVPHLSHPSLNSSITRVGRSKIWIVDAGLIENAVSWNIWNPTVYHYFAFLKWQWSVAVWCAMAHPVDKWFSNVSSLIWYTWDIPIYDRYKYLGL